MCAPFIASAQSVADIQSQIQNLLTQIKALQAQLQGMKGMIASSTHLDQQIPDRMKEWSDDSSTAPRMGEGMMGASDMNRGKGPECAAFSRSLMMGSQGDDVRNLQGVLHQHDLIASSSQTGFFGPQTAAALAKFQAKFGIASSTASSTPVVGPMTRGFLQKLCVQRAQVNMGNIERPMPPAWAHPDMDMPRKPEWNMPTTTRPMPPIPPRPCTAGPGGTGSPIPCPHNDQNRF